jgi:Flp pilus assembly secretin CpaC
MDADGLEFDQQNAAETSRPTKCNRTLLRICARFSVRSLFFFVLMIAAFLAGRQSRELYPSLWFLGRTRPSIPPQTAYVDSGSTLYVATSGNVPRLYVRDHSICDAQPDTPSQFRLLAKKPGTTTVLYWTEGSEEPVELSVVVAAHQ